MQTCVISHLIKMRTIANIASMNFQVCDLRNREKVPIEKFRPPLLFFSRLNYSYDGSIILFLSYFLYISC